MQNYQVTIYTRTGRTMRNITAPTNNQAMVTALNTLPDDEIPTCLICKTHADVCTLRAADEVNT